MSCRTSWDTSIKHYIRLGLDTSLTQNLKAKIPSSNYYRWKQESESKYKGCELTEHIKKDLELYKKIGETNHIKKINAYYFKLIDTYHQAVSAITGIKAVIKEQKEIVVNSIEKVKHIIPINNALKVFNMSRATYQNYKSIIIHKCEPSYFKWCKKRFPNQLLTKEVLTIKKYMTNDDYMFWSKASIYLKAIRARDLHCGISTFYKYCRLLGFNTRRHKRKSDNHHPKRTSRPNELWCADVTIFKSSDGLKQYIHFLMDHYSKMILGYRIEKSSSGKAIRDLIKEANEIYCPENLTLLTDGGSENVNKTVSHYINTQGMAAKHIIAQKDVVFSNSMIEALNKVIKHQFLYPREISSEKSLRKWLYESVQIYNNERPQWCLGGNTPSETFHGLSIDFNKYKESFVQLRITRSLQNRQNRCKGCS